MTERAGARRHSPAAECTRSNPPGNRVHQRHASDAAILRGAEFQMHIDLSRHLHLREQACRIHPVYSRMISKLLVIASFGGV